MKKFLYIFLILISVSYGEIEDYKSDFGIGIGMGLPSGYEIKGIYRMNDWISLSLNYNLFEIKGFSHDIKENDMTLNLNGDLAFSSPGILLNYHIFGGNWRVATGFLYDLGGLDVDMIGNVEVENEKVNVNGNVKVKLGKTYPYLGLIYGYDYGSTIHLEFSLGAYLLKTPTVDLNLTVEAKDAIEDALEKNSGLSTAEVNEIMAYLEQSGWNILSLKDYVKENYNVTVDMPSETELEDQIISGIEDGYSKLPKLMGYSVFPVVSIGITFFPF